MNFKRTGSKVKGFTLVELIVVIAIIGVLSGILSMAISAFMRDARIETNNNKAQMIYTGFQNILIQCEINQDDSLFDMHDNTSIAGDPTIPLDEVILCFGMDGSELHDDMYLEMSWQTSYASSGSSPISRTYYEDWYEKIEDAIRSEIDEFEGSVMVFMDLENYLVNSVIFFEPNIKSVDDLKSDLSTGSGSAIDSISSCASMYKVKDGNGLVFQMVDSHSAQREYYDNVGPHFGAYPMADSYGEDDAPVKVTS